MPLTLPSEIIPGDDPGSLFGRFDLTVDQSGLLHQCLAGDRLDQFISKRPSGEGRGQMVKRDGLVWVGTPATKLDPSARDRCPWLAVRLLPPRAPPGYVACGGYDALSSRPGWG